MNSNLHTERILYIYEALLKGRKFTVSEIHEEITRKIDHDISLRSVQRDLRAMQDCTPVIEQFKSGRQVYWRIPRRFRNTAGIVHIREQQFLSLYILKAYLSTFDGTAVQKEIEELGHSIERLCPGELYLSDTFFWDQNFGIFDYSEYGDILSHVIDAVTQKYWVRITYHSTMQQHEKTYEVYFKGLLFYNSTIYILTYFPYHKSFQAISLQGIKSIEKCERGGDSIPEFNYEEFRKSRFGIFSGKIYDVKLLIKARYREYFEHRKWHVTQRSRYDADGNLMLEMRAPIGKDMVSWIMGWNDAIIVLEPPELIDRILNNISTIQEQYAK
ncbi:MAG: helix-turn-helix transcriptional regulator [Candidatus Kapaibacterium sp.]